MFLGVNSFGGQVDGDQIIIINVFAISSPQSALYALINCIENNAYNDLASKGSHH